MEAACDWVYVLCTGFFARCVTWGAMYILVLDVHTFIFRSNTPGRTNESQGVASPCTKKLGPPVCLGDVATELSR